MLTFFAKDFLSLVIKFLTLEPLLCKDFYPINEISMGIYILYMYKCIFYMILSHSIKINESIYI